MTRRLLLALLAALALAAPAHAASGPAFGIRAVGKWKLGYFVFDSKPGAKIAGKIVVTNSGDRSGVVRVYATDATTGQTSGTVYLTSGEKPKGVGGWIELPASRLEIGPNERRVIPFTVVVPAGAAAGEHVGGIVAETAQQQTSPQKKGKTNVQVTVRNLAIVAVQVNTPGKKVASFHIGKVTVGGKRGFQQVFVRITNTGNVLVKPGLAVQITNDAKDVVVDRSVKLDTILPHTSIDYPLTVTGKAIPAGSYSSSVRLTYPTPGGGTAAATATPAVTVTPQQVQQVFTSAGPTQAPPGSTQAAAPAKASGSGSILVIVLAVVAGVSILAAVWFAATARARRPPKP